MTEPWIGRIGFLVAGAAFLGLLAACAHAPATPPITAPLPAVAAPSCIAVKDYTQDRLDQMAAAVRALPADSPLRGLVVDYQRLRDEARASCQPSK